MLFLYLLFPGRQTSTAQSFTDKPAASAPILIDKIAAVVNDEIITMMDIDKAIRFYPAFRKTQESEETFYARVLEDLINYKVVYLEYKDQYTLKEEDYNEVQTAVIEKLGSLEN